jgi:hypothetical protein
VAGRGRGTWAILRETRENRSERIVTEPLIHLSLKKLIGEQNTAKKTPDGSCVWQRGLPDTVWPSQSSPIRFAGPGPQPILQWVILGLR